MSTALHPSRAAHGPASARPASLSNSANSRSLFSFADLNMAKVLGQRFALAIELSEVGARLAYGEGAARARSALAANDPASHWKNERHAAAVAGESYRRGQCVIVYCASQTESEARQHFANWGRIVELQPLFNTATPSRPLLECGHEACDFVEHDDDAWDLHALNTRHPLAGTE